MDNIIEKLSNKKIYLIAGVVGLVIIILLLIATKATGDIKGEYERLPYSDVIEESLAIKLERFNDQYIFLDNNEKAQFVDTGVSTFRTILANTDDNISEEHTATIENIFINFFEEKLATSDFTASDRAWFASGSASIIWETLLNELQKLAAQGEKENEAQYLLLANHLQKEITGLENKLAGMKISANIKLPEGSEVDTKSLYSQLETDLAASDSLIEKLKNTLEGTLKNNIKREVVSEIGNSLTGMAGKDGAAGKNGKDGEDGINGKDGKDGIDGRDGKDGATGKNGVDGKNGIDGKDGKDGIDGKDGAAGKNGENGKDGKDGIDGKDGEDGAAGRDGQNSYIVYSEYYNGKDGNGRASFTDSPDMESKFIGTAIGTEKPTDPESYVWSQYKELSIEYQENNGKPTIILRR